MLEVRFVTVTTCVQLVNGVSGKMANGRPLLVCFGEPPGMYKLAPDPDFSAPETVSACAMATTGHTQDSQPAHVSNNVTAATGRVIELVAQSFLASDMGRSAAVTAAAADQLSRVKAQHAVSGSAALSAASPAGTASSPPATADASMHGIAPSARAFPPSTAFGVFGTGQKVNALKAPCDMSARLTPGHGAARPDALRQERPVTAPDAGPSAFQAPKSASVGFYDPAAPLPLVLVAALGQISAGKAAEAMLPRPASLQAQQSSRTEGVRKSMSEHERLRPGTESGTSPMPSTAGARSCTVCHEVDARKLYCCGSCEALLHEECTTRLPEPLGSYCLFCPDCQREPWHQGAIILVSCNIAACWYVGQCSAPHNQRQRCICMLHRMSSCTTSYATTHSLFMMALHRLLVLPNHLLPIMPSMASLLSCRQGPRQELRA